MSAASDRINKLFEEAKSDNYYQHAWYSHLDIKDVEDVVQKAALAELYWAAGFWDGEGSTFLTRGQYYTYPNCNAAQTRKEPLERFAAAVGVGKIFGPYKNKGVNRQDFWQWRALGKDSLPVIWQLFPLVSEPKREQFATVLSTSTAKYMEEYNAQLPTRADVESVLEDLARYESNDNANVGGSGAAVPAAHRLEGEVVVKTKTPKLFTFTDWVNYWKEKNARSAS